MMLTNRSALRLNILWGIREGLFLTGIVFVPATLFVLTKPDRSLLRFLEVFIAYLLFGAVGGAVVGSMRPRLVRWVPATMCGATIGAFGIVALVCAPRMGHPFPGVRTAAVSAVLGACMGAVLGGWAWLRVQQRSA